ncbi:hypothetical protein ScPMuIL_008022 [Solemya velum]
MIGLHNSNEISKMSYTFCNKSLDDDQPVVTLREKGQQTLIEISYYSSEQHKKSSHSRQERDQKDLNTILAFVEKKKQFAKIDSLRNIETGVTSTGDVNAHQARKIGSEIIQNIKGSIRGANKSSLADAIRSLGVCSVTPDSDGEMKYVFDGGSLLQKLPWPEGHTFSGICKLYADYVHRRYGSPTIVFDGYMTSTKDVTHQRRTNGVMGTNVIFTGDTPFCSKKEHFLANCANNQEFINMLSASLESMDCTVIHADSDADACIVKTTVTSASRFPTLLIGEDTDLLVLLCFYAQIEFSVRIKHLSK